MQISMQPDIRIFPNAVYTARLFRCYSCIRKTKIGKYTTICIQAKLTLVRSVKVSGKLPTYPSPKSHFALSEKVVLMLSQERGRWSEKKTKQRFERLPLGVLPPDRMRISILKYGNVILSGKIHVRFSVSFNSQVLFFP